MIEFISTFFLGIGCLFFFAGTLGLLRFPDVYTRLHALTKADNLGLGFILLGLLPHADNLIDAMKLVLVWLLVLTASSCVGFLIARRARRKGIAHWSSPE
jgi:multicomponent Na+:H+ antiporter subunit G